MIDELIRRYRIKHRKIVNIILQPDRSAVVAATIHEDVPVQWEFHFCEEFNREQTGEQTVSKK